LKKKFCKYNKNQKSGLRYYDISHAQSKMLSKEFDLPRHLWRGDTIQTIMGFIPKQTKSYYRAEARGGWFLI
jgi:hypothetical protein